MLCSVYGSSGRDIMNLYRTLPLFKKAENTLAFKPENFESAGLYLESSGGFGIWIIKSADMDLYESLDGACVVTCGFSRKDSISVSSNDGHLMTISVQRELPELEGGIVCQQEFQIKCRVISDAETATLAAGGLLCMGVKPPDFTDILF